MEFCNIYNVDMIFMGYYS